MAASMQAELHKRPMDRFKAAVPFRDHSLPAITCGHMTEAFFFMAGIGHEATNVATIFGGGSIRCGC